MPRTLESNIEPRGLCACGGAPFTRTAAVALALAASFMVPFTGLSQEAYIPQAAEYLVSGLLFGDQVEAAVDIRPSGGFLVWQDSFTDGDGSGISGRLLDSTLSGSLSSFRINEQGAGDQRRPDVALLSDGGAVVVWEGGSNGNVDVFARFMSPSNTWLGGDVLVNTHTAEPQDDATVIALQNGQAVVAWASYNQVSSTSLKDVYFQRFTSGGQKLGSPVRVNQTTSLNQRSPAAVTLSDGRFVVAWVSESQYFTGGTNEYYAVDVFARFYDASGVAQGAQFKINTTLNLCANPSLAASVDGGFLAAWSQKQLESLSNSWDVVGRAVSASGVGGTEHVLNNQQYGDQFGPKAAALGNDYMVVWTSLRQDGSHEGVFGRFLGSTGAPAGDEFQVNTTAVSKQILPDLAADGGTRFLAVWSGFTGITPGFDVFGQRYATVLEPLPPPGAPYVWALSDSVLKVSWASLAGFDLANYEVYADGAATASHATTNLWWNAGGLSPNSSHSYRLAYVLQDGRRSPLSPPTSGTTYFGGLVFFGIQAQWMAANYGEQWYGPSEDTDGDGATTLEEFLAGTDPNDPNSVLRTSLARTPQGFFLNWNTEPGKIYQVEYAPNLAGWTQVGGPRFAPGDKDSMYVGAQPPGMFRLVLLRN